MNFLKADRIHFTGIKGVGMTALACVAYRLKKTVTGSDTAEKFPTTGTLKTIKAKLKVGFDGRNLPPKCDLLIYTGAHQGANNPEVLAAKKRGIRCINYGQALAEATAGKKLIVTAGVGGKSTTAAMLATMLAYAGVRPSYAIGVGEINSLGLPGEYDRRGEYFVAESDEFVADPGIDPTPKFHYLSPDIAIIGNIEHDHPDIYSTLEDVYSSFKIFIDKLPDNGLLIANIDNPHVVKFLRSVNVPVVTYGFSAGADWQVTTRHLADKMQFFTLSHQVVKYNSLILKVPGKFNVLNAAACFAAGYQLGINPELLANGLKVFGGTKRRFELIKTVKKIDLYDDYAHHPLEIQALVTAAREWLPRRRLVAVFQSHTYSRTKALFAEFADSLRLFDVVLINDIFASARESETLGISGEILAQAVSEKNSDCYYAGNKSATLQRLKQVMQPGDVIITVGAGNNWLWHKDIIRLMRQG